SPIILLHMLFIVMCHHYIKWYRFLSLYTLFIPCTFLIFVVFLLSRSRFGGWSGSLFKSVIRFHSLFQWFFRLNIVTMIGVNDFFIPKIRYPYRFVNNVINDVCFIFIRRLVTIVIMVFLCQKCLFNDIG